MTINELIIKVRVCLGGIDQLQEDGGYWQTADGAKTGRIILRNLEQMLRDNWPDHAPAPADAAAVEAQQERQDQLDDLYTKDGRHEPSHPMHGLYTGLVQHTLTTNEDPMSEFVIFTTNDCARKIVIRRSSVHAFYPQSHQGQTIIDYAEGQCVVVDQSFLEVCAIMGTTDAPSQQEQS